MDVVFGGRGFGGEAFHQDDHMDKVVEMVLSTMVE